MNNSIKTFNFTLPTKSFKVSRLQTLYDECYKNEMKEMKDNEDDQFGFKKIQRIYKPITDYVTQRCKAAIHRADSFLR